MYVYVLNKCSNKRKL